MSTTTATTSISRTTPTGIAVAIAAPFAFLVCIATVLVFSDLYQHWFAMYAQLFHPFGWDVHPFDTTGVWTMIPVATIVLIIAGASLPLIHPEPLPFMERILWTGLAAIAIAGVPTVVVAMFGVLYEGVLLVFIGGLSLLVLAVVLKRRDWPRIHHWWAAWERSESRGWRLPELGRSILITYLIVMIAALLFHSATKPVYHFDALIYHDAMAKILANAHGMPLITGPSPGIEMSANYPPLFPALGAFTLLFAGGNDLFLRTQAALFGILASLAAYSIGRRQAGVSLGLLAAAFTMTAQMLPMYSTFGLVYSLMAFVAAMGFLALTSYVHQPNVIYLVLAGGCLGLMFLCSYQAAIYVAWIPVVVWLVRRNTSWRMAVTGLLAFGIPLATLGGFWYLRNWIVVGNPVYPWFYHFFGGLNLDSPLTPLAQASVSQVAHDVTFGFGQTPTLVNLLRVTFFDRSLFPVMSPIGLMGLLAALGLTTRSSAERLTVWMIIPCAVVPVLLFEATGTFFLRYFIPVIPILALLPAYFFYWLVRPTHWQRAPIISPGVAARLRRTVAIALVTGTLGYMLVFPGLLVALSGQFYYEGFDFQPGRPYLSGLHSINPNPYDFNAVAADPGFRAFQWVQDHLEPGQRVATYESRLYYLFGADWNRILFLDGREVEPIWNERDPAAVVRYFQSKHVKYVWLSRIVQTGADRLPLAQTIVGNTPEFPIVWNYTDAYVYQVSGPLKLGVGESPDVTMNNQSAWSDVSIRDGSPARAAQRWSPPNEPAGVFVQNNDHAGFLVFDYLDNATGSELALDIWTELKPTAWQRLLTSQLTGSGHWRSGLVWLPTRQQPYGVTRLAFRPSGGPVYIRNVHFAQAATNQAEMVLMGAWEPQFATDGQLLLIGNRATNAEAVKTQYADIEVTMPRNAQPYLDIRYVDHPGAVSVVQKIGQEEVPLVALLSAGSSTYVGQRIPLMASSLASGKAYLIFNTNGADFALQGVDYVLKSSSGESWEPAPQILLGPWRKAVVQGSVIGVAFRDRQAWSDIRVPWLPSPTAQLRLAYIDAANATLVVNSIDKANSWHVIAQSRTSGTNSVKYLNITAAESFPSSESLLYLVLDTKGTQVPVLGIQILVPDYEPIPKD